jgi:sec-independent protein translocase protein TatA
MGLENPLHLLVLAAIILVVFGSSKLPGMARSAGKHAREAKDGIATFKQEFDVGIGDDNPITQVTDTLRSANPRTIVKDAVSKTVNPSSGPAAKKSTLPGAEAAPAPAPAKPAPPASPERS